MIFAFGRTSKEAFFPWTGLLTLYFISLFKSFIWQKLNLYNVLCSQVYTLKAHRGSILKVNRWFTCKNFLTFCPGLLLYPVSNLLHEKIAKHWKTNMTQYRTSISILNFALGHSTARSLWTPTLWNYPSINYKVFFSP